MLYLSNLQSLSTLYASRKESISTACECNSGAIGNVLKAKHSNNSSIILNVTCVSFRENFQIQDPTR